MKRYYLLLNTRQGCKEMVFQISLGSEASQSPWIGQDKLYGAILYLHCCGGAGIKFPHSKLLANKKGLYRPEFLADNHRGLRFTMRVRATCLPFSATFKPSQKGCHHPMIGWEGKAPSCFQSAISLEVLKVNPKQRRASNNWTATTLKW